MAPEYQPFNQSSLRIKDGKFYNDRDEPVLTGDGDQVTVKGASRFREWLPYWEKLAQTRDATADDLRNLDCVKKVLALIDDYEKTGKK